MKRGTTTDPFAQDEEDQVEADEPVEDELVEQRDVPEGVVSTPEPESEPKTETEPEPLVDAIAEQLEAIERGDRINHLSVRDRPIAALLLALEDRPEERYELGVTLSETRGVDVLDAYNRSDIIREAIRLGIEEAAAEVLEDVADANARLAREV